MAGDEGTVTFGFTPILKNPLALEDGGTGSKTQPGAWERIVAPGGTFTGNVTSKGTLTVNNSLYLSKTSNPELVFKAGTTQRGNCRVYTGSDSGICFQFWQNGNGINEVFQLPTTSLTSGSGTPYYNILTTKDYCYYPNDSITLVSGWGYVSGGGTGVEVWFPVAKYLDKVSNTDNVVTKVTSMKGNFRAGKVYWVTGSYVDNGGYDFTSLVSGVTLIPEQKLIAVRLTSSSATKTDLGGSSINLNNFTIQFNGTLKISFTPSSS